ncbi:MAG: formylglycine-generating enzyme family protein [Desulfovibrio sp.]|jgi:formylglycine-generating enzyme required for sulfatase activity|nr:formylglycine-generating enzyme family protein [Desulfovibrio sp.]
MLQSCHKRGRTGLPPRTRFVGGRFPGGSFAGRLLFLCLFLAGLFPAALLPFPLAAAEATYADSLGMEFVLIPAGSFMMGSEARDNEKPRRRVSIGKAFYLGKYAVTQAQWTALMEENPSWFRGADLPVEQVFWDQAQEFINRLNRREGHTRYRLPTEAEWEYAARAGRDDADPVAADADALGRVAWYDRNSGNSTHPVGQKEPNAWGLYDMLGNVNEWVQDRFAADYYAHGPAQDPPGPESGALRVRRGGSWSDEAANCRVAARAFDAPTESLCGPPGCRLGDLGFRVLLMPE